MNLEQAGNEFAVRFFHWALDYARRQLSLGFRLFRSLPPDEMTVFFEILDGLSKPDQEALVVALVKDHHPRAMALLHLMTPQEQKIVEWYRPMRQTTVANQCARRALMPKKDGKLDLRRCDKIT
jgi:hypothetical protein